MDYRLARVVNRTKQYFSGPTEGKLPSSPARTDADEPDRLRRLRAGVDQPVGSNMLFVLVDEL
jgi:hypothetical protein